MRWRILVIGVCVLPVLFAGCTGGANPFASMKDPMAEVTFRDNGSNSTDWQLHVAGRFSLPNGVRLHLEANSTTCQTGGLLEIVEKARLECRDADGTLHHGIDAHDMDLDGRIDTGDLLVVHAPEGRPFRGNHTLTIALHPELPLFVLRQGFGPDGPEGRLSVELLG